MPKKAMMMDDYHQSGKGERRSKVTVQQKEKQINA